MLERSRLAMLLALRRAGESQARQAAIASRRGLADAENELEAREAAFARAKRSLVEAEDDVRLSERQAGTAGRRSLMEMLVEARRGEVEGARAAVAAAEKTRHAAAAEAERARHALEQAHHACRAVEGEMARRRATEQRRRARREQLAIEDARIWRR